TPRCLRWSSSGTGSGPGCRGSAVHSGSEGSFTHPRPRRRVASKFTEKLPLPSLARIMDTSPPTMAYRALPLAFLFILGLTACGDETEYCDSTGCYACDGMSCRQLPPPKSCEINADCGRDEYVCRDGMCVPDDRTCGGLGCSCAVTGTCDEGYVCTSDECRPEAEVCRFDHACGASQICIDGRCYAECADGAGCEPGFSCVEGACTP